MPTPISFPQQNIVLGENQPEYNPLPAFYDTSSPNGEFVTCWQFSPEELKEIQKTGKLWFVQLTFKQQFNPVSFYTECPITPDANAKFQ